MRIARVFVAVLLLAVIQRGAADGSKTSHLHEQIVDSMTVMCGDMGTVEVAALRDQLGSMSFPVRPEVIMGLFPERMFEIAVRPSRIEFIDLGQDDAQGRCGGNLAEYWLNEDVVLRVAYAYYRIAGTTKERAEWAVVLTKAERNAFRRDVLESKRAEPGATDNPGDAQ